MEGLSTARAICMAAARRLCEINIDKSCTSPSPPAKDSLSPSDWHDLRQIIAARRHRCGRNGLCMRNTAEFAIYEGESVGSRCRQSEDFIKNCLSCESLTLQAASPRKRPYYDSTRRQGL